MAHPVSPAKRLRVLRLHADNPTLSSTEIAIQVSLGRSTVERILREAEGKKPAPRKGD